MGCSFGLSCIFRKQQLLKESAGKGKLVKRKNNRRQISKSVVEEQDVGSEANVSFSSEW